MEVVDIGISGDVLCIFDNIQMEYVLPEDIESDNTKVICPKCGIAYLIPNELLRVGKIKLRAQF